jgi:hypothetical protein
MDRRALVVVEANEVPLRVVADLAEAGRVPFLASMLADGRLIETEITEDQTYDELYPSQTWASMNTGVPSSSHGLRWYNDTKSTQNYQFHWQMAARAGRSVGLVNTLHSSPVATRCYEGDYRFVIPDSFAADDETIPASYQAFQRANLALTSANTRKVDAKSSTGKLFQLARALPRAGIRLSTLREAARLLQGVRSGQVPRERLRSGQFLLHRDLFFSLLEEHRPDLAVVFTNHVAAAMHRYWYAFYPGDFAEVHYDPEWVERYREEIPVAMEQLDRFLAELGEWCEHTERTLVVVSSMGQGPSANLDTEATLEAVVVDGATFLRAVGVTDSVELLGSMHPQLTVACQSPADAAKLAADLADRDLGEVFFDVNRPDNRVTLSYELEPVDHHTIRVGGGHRPAEDLGVQVRSVDDHSSGRHTSRGILGVHNTTTFRAPASGVVDSLEYTPALLSYLGVEPAGYHLAPSFQF